MTFPDSGLSSDTPQKRYMGVRVKMPVRELLRKIRLSKGLDPAHSKVRTLLEFRKVFPRGVAPWCTHITLPLCQCPGEVTPTAAASSIHQINAFDEGGEYTKFETG